MGYIYIIQYFSIIKVGNNAMFSHGKAGRERGRVSYDIAPRWNLKMHKN